MCPYERRTLGIPYYFRTKPAVIGNLKNLIENDDIYIPDQVIIEELKTYIATESGKTEAAEGCHDDTVIAMGICAEVLRTHWDRLQTQNVSWTQKVADLKPDTTHWI